MAFSSTRIGTFYSALEWDGRSMLMVCGEITACDVIILFVPDLLPILYDGSPFPDEAAYGTRDPR